MKDDFCLSIRDNFFINIDRYSQFRPLKINWVHPAFLLAISGLKNNVMELIDSVEAFKLWRIS